jgi:hypothetical protein
MNEEIIKEEINKFAKIIEYHPSFDKNLDEISRIKQEIGLSLLSKLSDILQEALTQAREKAIEECLEEAEKIINTVNVLDSCKYAKEQYNRFKDKLQSLKKGK